MGDQRIGGIAWTDETWNPVRGCSRVSPGCENCYAERMASRFTGPGQAYEGLARIRRRVVGPGDYAPTGGKPQWTGEVRMVLDHLADPLRWQRPRRIFVNSMSDLFHEKLADDDIDRVFAVMSLAPQHTFQVLTKRPQHMHDYFAQEDTWARIEVSARRLFFKQTGKQIAGKTLIGPLPNVWLGVSAEDQLRADERIPLLLRTPAAVRFVSVEPQLEHVSATSWRYQGVAGSQPVKLDWLICGAESGPGARPFHEDWARSLRDQCIGDAVAFFYKQALDEHGKKVSTPELDGRTWTEFPEVSC